MTIKNNFVWGISTSAYQIEGAAREGGRGPSIWDTRCRTKGGIVDGSSGDISCDHYHHYSEDIAAMKAMGIQAYRFSVSWPRVLPRGRGVVNPVGLDFYDRLIDGLLEAQIEPWITLYHWDLPQALDDLGGWTNRECAGWFSDYAVLIAKRYGDRVKRFATFNEFSVFTLFGYAIDWAAPGVTDLAAHIKAIHHVNLAHGAGVDVLRGLVPNVSIGAIHNRQQVFPEHGDPKHQAAADLLNEHWNLAFPDPQLLGHYPPQIARAIEPYLQAGDLARICRPIDWFGLNHYGPIFAKSDPNTTWGFGWGESPPETTDHGVGWPVFPEYFREELLAITRRYRIPIYITENGCGGNTDAPNEAGQVLDPHRIRYLQLYTNAMTEAMQAGADVRGYFVWSLLDCFEWGSGYGQRFGLLYVDYPTQRRIPKASARWYAEKIAGAR